MVKGDKEIHDTIINQEDIVESERSELLWNLLLVLLLMNLKKTHNKAKAISAKPLEFNLKNKLDEKGQQTERKKEKNNKKKQRN